MGDSTTTRVTFGMCAEVAFRRNSDNASGISAFIYLFFISTIKETPTIFRRTAGKFVLFLFVNSI